MKPIRQADKTTQLRQRGKKDIEEIKSGVRIIGFSHRNKIFFPDEGYTKGDVLDYYLKISKTLLPYLKDRPQNLNRHPDGINSTGFFQKDVLTHPSWIRIKPIYSEAAKKTVHYIICNDEATLIYMVQLGSIEINPWNSRVSKIDNPDFLIIDLDPEAVPSYDTVVETALVVKSVMDEIGIKSYPKTTGARGMHIYVPMGAKYKYDVVRGFAESIAIAVHRRLPKITSIERHPAKRQGKVYLDYLQNSRGQTLAAPYSLRPKPGAPVSTPLNWSEVKKGLNPKKFNIKTIFTRLDKIGDIYRPVLGKGVSIESAAKKLEKI